MDRISGLPNDLLVKIISSLPTKVALSTSILSTRWQFLWMWLPILDYHSSNPALEDFINKNLPLHKASVIESFRLDLTASSTHEDIIKRWVGIAVSRYVRKLEIIAYSQFDNIFPSSLYTCKSLVNLKLTSVTLERVPSTACLPSLKTLHLDHVTYGYEKFLQELLSICPVLGELFVQFRKGGDEDVGKFSIVVPSLQSLTLFIPSNWFLDGYKIDTPSLMYFKFEDWNEDEHYCEIKNMPNLVEAYVNVRFKYLKSVIGSITSVKRLTIRSKSLNTDGEDVNGGGVVFSQLEHLELKCSGARNRSRDDDDALTIAKSMLKLRKLQLVENKLRNTGLNAILDNCPHLEHLDLRKCWNIDLFEDLEKRCLEMLKEFRRPQDSTDDLEFEFRVLRLLDTDTEEETEEEESENDDNDSEEEEEESEDEDNSIASDE